MSKEDIPAATQIFTPNWIVKYMVQNTIGRIYLDNNPYSTLEEKMQYLVKPTEPTPEDTILRIDDIKEYKLIDPACGSGHILNERFDLLYEMYMEEFYSPRMAIESIFRNNLIGIDLDTRAKQLASFALLMKAAQKDRSFLDAKVMPRVLDMPEPFSYPAGVEEFLPHYFLGGSREAIKETAEAFKLLEQAQNLGSIMKFEISDATRHLIATRTEEWKKSEFIPEVISQAIPSMEIILALTDKYTSVVANPPYMGGGKMNSELSRYLSKNYPMAKADLFSTFMEVMLGKTVNNGRTAFITMESWMFLSSFEQFRKHILDNYHISSLGHFGWHIIGIAFGTAMTVIENHKSNGRKGEYSYLTIDDIDRIVNIPIVFPKKDNGRYAIVNQQDFEKIPGCPIGYWVSEKALNISANSSTIAQVAFPKQGLATGNNDRFLRFCWEIQKNKRGLAKWVPCTKGGPFRKWYGNIDYCVNWENDGYEIKNYYGDNGKLASRPQNLSYYFKQIGCTWSTISSGKPAFRKFEKEWLFETKGSVCFPNDISDNDLLLAYFNSPLVNYYLKLFSPTLDYHEGPVGKLPFYRINDLNLKQYISDLVENNIEISKQDWDAHETSWDFQRSPLLDVEPIDGEQAHPESLKWRIAQYKRKWKALFHQLHANEEELNRQFIEIYGLQDELRPEVPMDEITILQQGEIRFLPCPGSSGMYGAAIEWNDDVLMKQLLSYAIGCWMGRYRLDKPGLHIAHPNPSDEEVCTYDVNGFRFEIDDDGIIPLMEHQNPFEDDNALQKIVNFVKMVFGENTLTENLNFIEHSLGKSIETYLMKDFWKDHKKMYQNRPIYWLFSSKKGAFQVLVYMHRMNPYTAEKVRTKYLLPYIDFLQTKIQQDRDRGADLSTIERKNLSKMEIALEECLEYHDRLHKVADQRIGFDLDDGVVVNYAKFGDVLAKIK